MRRPIARRARRKHLNLVRFRGRQCRPLRLTGKFATIWSWARKWVKYSWMSLWLLRSLLSVSCDARASAHRQSATDGRDAPRALRCTNFCVPSCRRQRPTEAMQRPCGALVQRRTFGVDSAEETHVGCVVERDSLRYLRRPGACSVSELLCFAHTNVHPTCQPR